MMEILDVFLQFTRGIADIELYRSANQSAADREYAHLVEQQQRMTEWGRTDRFKSSHNMFFQDCTSGSPVFYGFRTQTIEDAIESLVRHANRQHQWFLAEAYELFEEYVKHAYACMGISNPTTWPLRDFGSVRWGDVTAKDFDWFLQQARLKKDAPLSMLRQFREVLPRMKHVEGSNRLDCNLLVAVTLVGHMRHRIVHAGGFIQDEEKFAQDIVGKLGYSGSAMAPHIEFIRQTLLVRKSDGAIHLLNVRAPDSNSYVRTHYDILNDLVRYLLVYAHQLYLSLGGEAIQKFDELPGRGGPTGQPPSPDNTAEPSGA